MCVSCAAAWFARLALRCGASSKPWPHCHVPIEQHAPATRPVPAADDTRRWIDRRLVAFFPAPFASLFLLRERAGGTLRCPRDLFTWQGCGSSTVTTPSESYRCASLRPLERRRQQLFSRKGGPHERDWMIAAASRSCLIYRNTSRVCDGTHRRWV